MERKNRSGIFEVVKVAYVGEDALLAGRAEMCKAGYMVVEVYKGPGPRKSCSVEVLYYK